jgi:hypothetical protein
VTIVRVRPDILPEDDLFNQMCRLPRIVIARNPCDEAIQTAAVERLWLASAFAKASADKSLRSQ